MSVALIVAVGRSWAIATATQPQPVQTSAIDSGTDAIRKQLLHRLDDQLGRRAGNQHVGRHLELEPPELADADDVGERLAGDAPGDQRVVARREAVRHRLARVGQKALGRPAEHVLREQARVEIRLGGGDAGVAQPLPRGRDLGVDAHETAVASLSFSDW